MKRSSITTNRSLMQRKSVLEWRFAIFSGTLRRRKETITPDWGIEMHRNVKLASAIIMLTASGVALSATIGEVVQTKNGAVRGTTVTELEKVTANIYRGIPYAAPPVGELR